MHTIIFLIRKVIVPRDNLELDAQLDKVANDIVLHAAVHGDDLDQASTRAGRGVGDRRADGDFGDKVSGGHTG